MGYLLVSFFLLQIYSDSHSFQNQYECYTLVGTLHHMIIFAFDVCHYLLLELCSIHTLRGINGLIQNDRCLKQQAVQL